VKLDELYKILGMPVLRKNAYSTHGDFIIDE